MPIYSYLCTCGKSFDEPRSIGDRERPAMCPCGLMAHQDKVGSMKPHTDMGYQKEILSDALGVHPCQIAEAQRRFPNHRFHPDGRMILGSHQERKKVMKELGFFDKAGYH